MRSSRSAATRTASAARRRADVTAATAKALIAGASRVPERTSRSWPPPCSTGTGATARPRISAPTPTGPPSLCAVTVIASTPDAAKSTGSCAAACTASVWKGTPYSCATAASAAIGCTAPTSLLAHITLTRAAPSAPSGPGRSAARSASACTSPQSSTGSHCGDAPSASASQRTESSTA